MEEKQTPQMQLRWVELPAPQELPSNDWIDAMARRVSGVLPGSHALVVERHAPAANPTRARALLKPKIWWNREGVWFCGNQFGFLGSSVTQGFRGAVRAYRDWHDKNHG